MPGLYFRIKTALNDLFFPIECFGCGKAGSYLCPACFSAMPLESAFVCPICLRPSFEGGTCKLCKKTSSLDGLIAASFYDIPVLRSLVFALKYKFVKDVAPILGLLALKRLATHDFSLFHRNDLAILPVPLSGKRKMWRGFNQAEEIAKKISGALSIPLYQNALVRSKNTSSQVGKERTERFKNIHGAFRVVDAGPVSGRCVMLVDDVATTCATLEECASVLKAAGAKEVWGLVAAREYSK